MSISEFKPKRSKKYEENYSYVFSKKPTFIKKIIAWLNLRAMKVLQKYNESRDTL